MQITCTVPDCGKPHRAKGYCSTHYNQLCLKAERHVKVSVACSRCGTACIKDRGREKRYGSLYCSLECRDDQKQMHKLPVLFVGTIRIQQPERAVAVQLPARLWTAGRCLRCKDPFVDRQPTARFCSVRCGRIYSRKLHKKTSGVTTAVRQHVFARDGWRCQICMRLIKRTAVMPHPLSPSIDHIIPQSQGGSHDAVNLRAAHFLCNALRGDRGGPAQLALLG